MSNQIKEPRTPLFVLRTDVPSLNSFDFETDLRAYTTGQTFETIQLDYWEIVPGDPLDRTIELKLLEPNAPPMLARDMIIKTRRRKRLLEDLAIGVMRYWEVL